MAAIPRNNLAADRLDCRNEPGGGMRGPVMTETYRAHLRGILDQIRADGFYKAERVISSPQSAEIALADGRRVLNFCANNYLGLADDARLIAAAKQGLDQDG